MQRATQDINDKLKVATVKPELEELAATLDYVFHGSPDKIELLEPKQPYTFDKEKKTMIEDGAPAVAATPYLEIAIFRAIINGKNIPDQHWSGFGYNGETKKVELRASQDTLDRAQGKIGYVHVLNKKDFTPREPNRPEMMEWRSSKPVAPVKVIEISSDDLPNDIAIESSPV